MEKTSTFEKRNKKALENAVNLKPWFRWNRQWITPKPQREANFKKTKRNHSLTLLGAARQPAPLFFQVSRGCVREQFEKNYVRTWWWSARYGVYCIQQRLGCIIFWYILYSFHAWQCNVSALSCKRLTANLFFSVTLKVIACDGEYAETRLMNSGPKTNPWMQAPP